VVGEAGLGLGPRRTKAESANPRSCLWGERREEEREGQGADRRRGGR
jgi:hypothetical protein